MRTLKLYVSLVKVYYRPKYFRNLLVKNYTDVCRFWGCTATVSCWTLYEVSSLQNKNF